MCMNDYYARLMQYHNYSQIYLHDLACLQL